MAGSVAAESVHLRALVKLPRHLQIVAALPRNATGKILKYQLRQTFAKPRTGR